MGFKIPHYLRDRLSRQFNRTEFDRSVFDRPVFGRDWASPVLGKLDQLHLAMGYTPQQRRDREDAADAFAYFASNLKETLNINLERDMSIYEKKQTTYEKTKNTLKTFTVDVLQFEIINNHGVRVLAVPTDEANNLDEKAAFIISYGDASLLAVKTGSIESSLNRHFIVIQFNLIALRESTDWECAVVD